MILVWHTRVNPTFRKAASSGSADTTLWRIDHWGRVVAGRYQLVRRSWPRRSQTSDGPSKACRLCGANGCPDPARRGFARPRRADLVGKAEIPGCHDEGRKPRERCSFLLFRTARRRCSAAISAGTVPDFRTEYTRSPRTGCAVLFFVRQSAGARKVSGQYQANSAATEGSARDSSRPVLELFS